jgi:hypothetical protein
MEVNYELHHDGVEKGQLTVVRSKSGGLWQTHVENKNLQKPNVTPIFQDFEIKVIIYFLKIKNGIWS